MLCANRKEKQKKEGGSPNSRCSLGSGVPAFATAHSKAKNCLGTSGFHTLA